MLLLFPVNVLIQDWENEKNGETDEVEKEEVAPTDSVDEAATNQKYDKNTQNLIEGNNIFISLVFCFST